MREFYDAVKALESIRDIETQLRRKVQDERKSYKMISMELKNQYPHVPRGFSARSIRRFCDDQGIHATSRLTALQLDRVVASSVYKVSKVCM